MPHHRTAPEGLHPKGLRWKTVWPWLLALVVLGTAGFTAAYLTTDGTLVPSRTVASLGDTALDTDPQAQANSAAPAETDVPTPTSVPPTETLPPPTEAATATPEASATAAPTATPEETATPTPTETAAPTATPDTAQLTIRADLLNARSGPGTAYPVIGRAKLGESFPITGKSQDGKWWEIAMGDRKAWVAGEWAQVAGPVQSVAAVEVAPPPTPKPQAQVAAAAGGAAPRPSGGGFYAPGIQIDPGGDRGSAIGAVKALGMNWVKFQLPWKDFEGTPGQRNFPDDIVNDLSANGISILASIVKAPQWARPGNSNFSVEGPPADPGTYAAYVGEFAGRYCGRVQAIEVWNEQNLWYEWGGEPLDAGRYVRLLAAAYRAIKAACPSMIVVSGAPTPTGAQPPAAIRDTVYLEQMYRAGLRNFADAIGVHPSGYGNPPDARVQDYQAGNYSRPSHVNDSSFYFRNTMEQYRNIMVKYGDANKRLWPTEFGWASSGSPVPGYEYAAYNSEQAQGEYIARAFQMMRNWGFVGVAFLWNLNYNVTQPGSELAAFGIMGRPAFGYVQAAPK
jgi:hypothetical protein